MNSCTPRPLSWNTSSWRTASVWTQRRCERWSSGRPQRTGRGFRGSWGSRISTGASFATIAPSPHLSLDLLTPRSSSSGARRQFIVEVDASNTGVGGNSVSTLGWGRQGTSVRLLFTQTVPGRAKLRHREQGAAARH